MYAILLSVLRAICSALYPEYFSCFMIIFMIYFEILSEQCGILCLRFIFMGTDAYLHQHNLL